MRYRNSPKPIKIEKKNPPNMLAKMMKHDMNKHVTLGEIFVQ